jgi:hypothetical protein
LRFGPVGRNRTDQAVLPNDLTRCDLLHAVEGIVGRLFRRWRLNSHMNDLVLRVTDEK